MRRYQLVLTTVTLSFCLGIAGSTSAQRAPLELRVPVQQTFTCPPTVPPTWMPGPRPDGWRQFFTNAWFVYAQYDQALHKIKCHYRGNPGDLFTTLERHLDKGLVNCKVATNAVVCEQALPLAPGGWPPGGR